MPAVHLEYTIKNVVFSPGAGHSHLPDAIRSVVAGPDRGAHRLSSHLSRPGTVICIQRVHGSAHGSSVSSSATQHLLAMHGGAAALPLRPKGKGLQAPALFHRCESTCQASAAVGSAAQAQSQRRPGAHWRSACSGLCSPQSLQKTCLSDSITEAGERGAWLPPPWWAPRPCLCSSWLPRHQLVHVMRVSWQPAARCSLAASHCRRRLPTAAHLQVATSSRPP